MPVAGRDVVPNVPDLFGGLAFERLVRTRREGREGKPDHSSFARREEDKWDVEDSVLPDNGCGDFSSAIGVRLFLRAFTAKKVCQQRGLNANWAG